MQTTVETIVSLYLSDDELNRIKSKANPADMLVHLRDQLARVLTMQKGHVTFLDQEKVAPRYGSRPDTRFRFRVYPPVMSDAVPGVLTLQSHAGAQAIQDARSDPAAYITRAFFFEEDQG